MEFEQVLNVENRSMDMVEDIRKMSSVRPVWEDVLETRRRETQCGGSISGIFPPEPIDDPQKSWICMNRFEHEL